MNIINLFRSSTKQNCSLQIYIHIYIYIYIYIYILYIYIYIYIYIYYIYILCIYIYNIYIYIYIYTYIYIILYLSFYQYNTSRNITIFVQSIYSWHMRNIIETIADCREHIIYTSHRSRPRYHYVTCIRNRINNTGTWTKCKPTNLMGTQIP